ncbi:MAG TPA: slipin family protein [Phycisphaerales bacterium]|nr:slipin family protein [Phycisphaerales bacterium]
MAITVRIRTHERGLRFRHGQIVGLLGPGTHRLWSRLWSNTRDRIDVVSTLGLRFNVAELEAYLAVPSVREALQVVELTETQRALIWVDGRLYGVFGPGRYAFWRQPAKVEVETFDIDAVRFEHPRLEQVIAHPTASTWLEWVDPVNTQDVLLIRNGRVVEKLAPGRHAFWRGTGRQVIHAVDRRERIAEVSGQEIMTSDKLSLRVNLLVTYRVTDAEKMISVVTDADQAVYREAQLALRAAVGTRTLDQLLADKESVGGEVRSVLAGRATEFGVEVRSAGLRDIILPGELRSILNQVIEAQKRAEAELIKRREETASARSQANTAKLLAENPVLARMRELEALQGVLAGAKATFVFAPGDIAGQVRSLVARDGVNSAGAASVDS